MKLQMALNGAVLLVGLGAPLSGWRLARVEGDLVKPATTVPSAQPEPAAFDRRDLSELVRLAQAETPFRVGGLPPRIRYGAQPPVPVSQVPREPRPVLQLSGILWGREPAALVEGIPGREGAVVLHLGESAGSIKVVQLTETVARLSGMDTVWTLTVREPWP